MRCCSTDAPCRCCMQDSTCIAFDLMSVNLADLPVLPSLLPALRLLFEKESEEPEDQELAAGAVEAGAAVPS